MISIGAVTFLVAIASATGVQTNQGRAEIEPLIERLERNQWDDAALREIRRLGPQAKAAVPVLVPMLRQPIYTVLEALRAIGTDPLPAAPAVIDVLQDPAAADTCRACVSLAVEVLGTMGPAVLPAVLAAIGEGDTDGVLIFVPDIVRQVGPAALPALLAALGDAPLRRHAAVWALAVLGPDAASAAPVLVGFLERDPVLREDSTDTLRAIGPAASAVVPRLTSLIGNENVDVRRAAVTVLGAIGPAARAAVPVLDDLRARDAALAAEAAKAVQRILTPNGR
jgi:hypothetical protein